MIGWVSLGNVMNPNQIELTQIFEPVVAEVESLVEIEAVVEDLDEIIGVVEDI